jgi:hypothetical protein
MANPQLTASQVRILDELRKVRAEHRGCTAAELARRLRTDRGNVNAQLEKMQKLGVVDFSREVWGSIHIVGEPDRPDEARAWILREHFADVTPPAPVVSAPVERPKKPRTPAQIAHSEHLAELSRQRKAARDAASAQPLADGADLGDQVVPVQPV